MLCYGFLTESPGCSSAPLAPCGSQAKHCAISHATEQDTLPIASLISKKVVPYRTRGGTIYFRGVYS
jgi:hypothetical protein